LEGERGGERQEERKNDGLPAEGKGLTIFLLAILGEDQKREKRKKRSQLFWQKREKEERKTPAEIRETKERNCFQHSRYSKRSMSPEKGGEGTPFIANLMNQKGKKKRKKERLYTWAPREDREKKGT